MSDWTEDELAEFDNATWQNSSIHQMDRIEARLTMMRLLEQHGREKCDAMWAELKRREAVGTTPPSFKASNWPPRRCARIPSPPSTIDKET